MFFLSLYLIVGEENAKGQVKFTGLLAMAGEQKKSPGIQIPNGNFQKFVSYTPYTRISDWKRRGGRR